MGFDPLSLLGGIPDLIGGVMNLFGQDAANKAQAANQQKQMDWQTQMSNTAHTREVADLHAAGLNPILSATGGRGASTGSTGLTSPQNTMGGLAAGVSSAGSFARAESRRLDNETAIAESQVGKNNADRDNAATSAQRNLAELELIDPRMRQINAEIEYTQAKLGKVPQELLNLKQDLQESLSRERLNKVNVDVAAQSAKESAARTKSIGLDQSKKGFTSTLADVGTAALHGELYAPYKAWAEKAAAGPDSWQNKFGDWWYDKLHPNEWKSQSDAAGHGPTVSGGVHSAKQITRGSP